MVAQVVLPIQIMLDGVLVDVGARSRHDFGCCLGEYCIAICLLYAENLRWSDHLGDSL